MPENNVIKADFGKPSPMLSMTTRTELLYIDDNVALYRVMVDMNGERVSTHHYMLSSDA